jgi:hypothetical protein
VACDFSEHGWIEVDGQPEPLRVVDDAELRENLIADEVRGAAKESV